MPTWLMVVVVVWLVAVTVWCLWMHLYLSKTSKWINDSLVGDYWKAKDILNTFLTAKFADWPKIPRHDGSGGDVPPGNVDYP